MNLNSLLFWMVWCLGLHSLDVLTSTHPPLYLLAGKWFTLASSSLPLCDCLTNDLTPAYDQSSFESVALVSTLLCAGSDPLTLEPFLLDSASVWIPQILGSSMRFVFLISSTDDRYDALYLWPDHPQDQMTLLYVFGQYEQSLWISPQSKKIILLGRVPTVSETRFEEVIQVLRNAQLPLEDLVQGRFNGTACL